MTNIYVGNLIWRCTDEDLRTLFEEFGTVAKAEIVCERETGRSRGFGFVTMPNSEEAQAAIQELNGAEFGGRNLTVNEAKVKEQRQSRPRQNHNVGYRGAPRY